MEARLSDSQGWVNMRVTEGLSRFNDWEVELTLYRGSG